MIGLINYGSGNIHAIANIYKSLNIPHFLSSEIVELEKANKLVLPGVGAFDETMQLFQKHGIKNWLNEAVLERKTPIIGVCVGMQIMAKNSEEGKEEGFGWFNAQVRIMKPELLKQKPLLPHLGWNTSTPVRESDLFHNVNHEKGFYFLHNYYFECEKETDVLAYTDYGFRFASSVQHENVYGVQFHPEKSHQNGTEIFRNFANL